MSKQYRASRQYRAPAKPRYVVEAVNAEGKAESFLVPGSARLMTIVASIPTMRLKGFTNIRITNAA